MADLQPLGNAISDDDELASVLAGVKNEAAGLDPSPAIVPDNAAASPYLSAPPAIPPTPEFNFAQAETPVAPPAPAAITTPAITTPVAASPELEALKKETLSELRPLVGKLDLPAEEKFDTLLLIIRSTDDQSLLGPAHDAAKSIGDETRRASALLDVIKEIDYFSNKA